MNDGKNRHIPDIRVTQRLAKIRSNIASKIDYSNHSGTNAVNSCRKKEEKEKKKKKEAGSGYANIIPVF